MLTCDAARAALLDAELADLEPGGAGPLARHLGACPACHHAAERVLAATRGLRAARATVPRVSAAHAAATARTEAARVRRRRARWAWAPTLAAAGLAAVLLARPGRAPSPAPVSARPPVPPPLIESAAPHVAVFATDNPTITVVWQF